MNPGGLDGVHMFCVRLFLGRRTNQNKLGLLQERCFRTPVTMIQADASRKRRVLCQSWKNTAGDLPPAVELRIAFSDSIGHEQISQQRGQGDEGQMKIKIIEAQQHATRKQTFTTAAAMSIRLTISRRWKETGIAVRYPNSR